MRTLKYLKFGIWHKTKTWHVVKPDNKKEKMVTICNSKWIDNFPGRNYTLPNGVCLGETQAITYFNLDHICKNCIKMAGIEDVKTYIIYHKLGIKI